MATQIADWRGKARVADAHRRTPDLIADLYVALCYFMQFAQAAGAFDATGAQAWLDKAWSTLLRLAERQAQQQKETEPSGLFLRLIGSALSMGRAHLCGLEGGAPAKCSAWGWSEGKTPAGDRIGWVDSEDIYLEPHVALATAQRLAMEGGERLDCTSRSLHRELHDRGVLKRVDTDRGVHTVRKTVGGRRFDVLCLDTWALGTEPEAVKPEQLVDLK